MVNFYLDYIRNNYKMANKKVIGGRQPEGINPFVTEIQFPNSTNLFKIGDFEITTNETPRKIKDYSNDLSAFSQVITLDTLKINDVKTIAAINSYTNDIVLNFDKNNLSNYGYYGSTNEILRVSIENIIKNWAGSLYVNNLLQSSFYDTVFAYKYNRAINESSFNIPAYLIVNNFGLNYINTYLHDVNYETKNVTSNYNNYVIYTNNTEYKILNFTGSTTENNGVLSVVVLGNPFPDAVTSITKSISYHIKPNQNLFNQFYNALSPLEKHILSQDTNPLYTLKAKVLVEDENTGEIYTNDATYTWPVIDGYNIDTTSILFSNYAQDVLDLGYGYDQFKTDLIYRLWMPQSIKETDTTLNNKSGIFSRILGRQMDEIKLFVNSLAYINNVSYNKVENTPDNLVKKLAKTLGWKTFNIIEAEDLFASIFTTNTDLSPNNLTPTELDIELWRRIIMNTNYLFKAKGTRKAIEAIFALIGAPDCLIEFNEYVYTVNGRINPDNVDLTILFPVNEGLTRLPYDSNGYPQSVNQTNDFFFQISGNTDFGQSYIDMYRKIGFTVNKTIDNKKSWVYIDSATTRFDDFTLNPTNYDILSSKLVINTKEVDTILDPIKAIECDVYNYNYDTIYYPVSLTGRTYPYPQRESNKINVKNLTFNDYIHEIYSRFVNAQNRKTIDDGRGGGYPSLYKLYNDYLKREVNDGFPQSNRYTVGKMLKYMENFQSFYSRFFDQLTPATTIISGNGTRYRNTVFTPQKFTYKRGIDEGSEFSNLTSNEISDTLYISTITADVTLPINCSKNIFELNGLYCYSVDGTIDNDQLLIIKKQYQFYVPIHTSITVFNLPIFIVDGASKIIPSIPSNAIYVYNNINNITGKTLNFTFTGNTEYLTGLTYNTTFKYDLYQRTISQTGFTNNSVYSKSYTNGYFTGGTTYIPSIVPNESIIGDAEYLIKGNYTYFLPYPTANTINFGSQLSMYDNFDKNIYPILNVTNYNFNNNLYSGYTGTTYSTDYNLNQYPYGIYNESFDWYFVSVNQPDKALFINPTPSGGVIQPKEKYFVETITPDVTNKFIITYNKLGDIQVSVNGSTLIKNVEFNDLTVGIPSSFLGRTFQLNVPFDPLVDTLTLTYLTDFSGLELINEVYSVTIIPTGNTQTLPYKVLYNNTGNTYEYFLDNNLSGNTNNIQIDINGSPLIPITEYYVSITNPFKVILNVNIQSGDTINVFYSRDSINGVIPTTIQINTNPFNFQWIIDNIINTNINGNFYLEFSNDSDINFNTIITSGVTVYNHTGKTYNFSVDFLAAPYNSILLPNNIYNVRIKSDKEYVTINNSIIHTYSFSDYLRIKIPL